MKRFMFVLLCFLGVLTVLALLAGLGRGDGPGGQWPTTIATKATSTITEPPITTQVTTTVQLEPVLTPGEKLAQSMVPIYEYSSSMLSPYGSREGSFFLAEGHTNGAFVPITVSESGIYSIVFDVEHWNDVENFVVYIRNGYGDPYSGFVTENFQQGASELKLDLALNEGTNNVFIWLQRGELFISSVTYVKVLDYDIAITDFMAGGIGTTELYSGNACLRFYDVGDVSDSVIRSEYFTIAEDGAYDLSFIAGSKCIPAVRICDINGTVIRTIEYEQSWNDYGVEPSYNNQSVVHISPEIVDLPAGKYCIEVAFGSYYVYADAILVHSAYLTKK